MDIDNDGICDTFAKYVWEPATSKMNSYSSATEAATLVLSVDETVRNPQVCSNYFHALPPSVAIDNNSMGAMRRCTDWSRACCSLKELPDLDAGVVAGADVACP